MALTTARQGYTVQIRNADGESQNAVVGALASDLPTPGAPVTTPTTGGTLASSTTFGYKLTAIVNQTETQASAEFTEATGVADNAIDIDWTASPVAGATSYKVYGRTSTGPWGFLAEVTGTLYTDDGSDTPGDAAPTTSDHVGVFGTHDGVQHTRVLKATALRQADRYYYHH